MKDSMQSNEFNEIGWKTCTESIVESLLMSLFCAGMRRRKLWGR